MPVHEIFEALVKIHYSGWGNLLSEGRGYRSRKPVLSLAKGPAFVITEIRILDLEFLERRFVNNRHSRRNYLWDSP